MYDQMTRLLAEMLREKWHQGDTESTTRIVKKAMEEVRAHSVHIKLDLNNYAPTVVQALP